MKKYENKSPEEVIKLVTTEIIIRSIKLAKQKNRTILISKTSGGKGIDVATLNPKTAEGMENLTKLLFKCATTLHN